MKPRFALLPLLASLASACGGATAINPNYDLSKVRRIGVLRFESSYPDLGTEDHFSKHLLQRGFSVVERSHLESLLKEQRLSLTGLYNPGQEKDLGRILGVDALMIGRVTSYEPERKEVVLAKTRATYVEPVFETVRKRRRRKKESEDGKERPPSYVDVQVQVGTTTRHEDREIPQIFTIDAQVGVVAKLVDVESGEIIWVGSTTGEGINADYAVDSAVSYLVRKLRKDWK